jgi:hypothetical protein
MSIETILWAAGLMAVFALLLEIRLFWPAAAVFGFIFTIQSLGDGVWRDVWVGFAVFCGGCLISMAEMSAGNEYEQ